MDVRYNNFLKLFLAVFAVIGYSQSMAFDIVYQNTTDGKCYKKSSENSEAGSAITPGYCSYPTISPNGTEMVYTNASGLLYKKSLSDASAGTQINSVNSSQQRYSPDGSYIAYRAVDVNQLYRKLSNDSSNGQQFTATNVYGTYPSYSLDGFVYFRNGADGTIWKKDANTISDGSQLVNVNVNNLSVTPDGSQIVYSRNSDGALVKKNSNDSGVGSVILSLWVDNFQISPDGTEIVYVYGGQIFKKSINDTLTGDNIYNGYNGLVGTLSVSYFAQSSPSSGSAGYTATINGLTCTTVTYPYFSSAPYTIGQGNFSDNSSGSTIPQRYNFQWLASNNSYQDRFSVFPSTGLYLNTDTFTGGISAGVQSTVYSDLENYPNSLTSLSVTLTRSGQTAPMNYVRIKTENRGFSPLNSNEKNVVATVRFNGIDNILRTFPLVYSGGYAIALSTHPAKNINIQFTTGTVTFDGFEVGYANSGSVSKTSCKNSSFSCHYTQQSPGVFTCDSALNVSGIPQGECEEVNNRCQPKADIIPYYDGAIVPGGAVQQAIDSSGAVVGLDYQGEDIFACSQSGIAVLICPFEVLSKVWAKFTFVLKKIVNLIYGISSLGSPSGKGTLLGLIIPTANASIPNLSTPFDNGSGTSSESYTGFDLGGLNKTILKASDNVNLMGSDGIKGVYAFAMWSLILIGVVVVVVIFFLAFS